MSGLSINPRPPLTSVNMTCTGDYPTGRINLKTKPGNPCPGKSRLILPKEIGLTATTGRPGHFRKQSTSSVILMAVKWEVAPPSTEGD